MPRVVSTGRRSDAYKPREARMHCHGTRLSGVVSSTVVLVVSTLTRMLPLCF